MKRLLLLSQVCLLSLVISGCGLRPSEKITYIISEPGMPIQIVEEKDLYIAGAEMKTGKIINQKINGWVAMPSSHWSVVKAKLNGVAKYEYENHVSIAPLAEVVQ